MSKAAHFLLLSFFLSPCYCVYSCCVRAPGMCVPCVCVLVLYAYRGEGVCQCRPAPNSTCKKKKKSMPSFHTTLQNTVGMCTGHDPTQRQVRSSLRSPQPPWWWSVVPPADAADAAVAVWHSGGTYRGEGGWTHGPPFQAAATKSATASCPNRKWRWRKDILLTCQDVSPTLTVCFLRGSSS